MIVKIHFLIKEHFIIYDVTCDTAKRKQQLRKTGDTYN
jgi:hypothetical protein